MGRPSGRAPLLVRAGGHYAELPVRSGNAGRLPRRLTPRPSRRSLREATSVRIWLRWLREAETEAELIEAIQVLAKLGVTDA